LSRRDLTFAETGLYQVGRITGLTKIGRENEVLRANLVHNH
jgi:hypothetical protein